MKALGGREAKRNIVLLRPGGMKAGYAQCDEAGHLAGALARRERIGRSMFDGHIGIREVVRTVTNSMTGDWSGLRDLEDLSGRTTVVARDRTVRLSDRVLAALDEPVESIVGFVVPPVRPARLEPGNNQQ